MKAPWTNPYSPYPVDTYLASTPYSEEALDSLFTEASLTQGSHVCDIGAGTGELTVPLALRGYSVTAVEPNSVLRYNGIKRTKNIGNVSWLEANGLNTGLDAHFFDYVTFGSSLDVMDEDAALRETHRLLKPGAWFTCIWNQRDLEDRIQKDLDEIIRGYIPSFSSASRRKLGPVIKNSGFFEKIHMVMGRVKHVHNVDDVIKAWLESPDLQHQAGDAFPELSKAIREYLFSLNKAYITIPYITTAWTARNTG